MIIENTKKILPRTVYNALRGLAFEIMYKVRTSKYGRGPVRLAGLSLELSHAIVTPALRREVIAGTYEMPETRLIKRYLTPGDRVLELGAGMGFTELSCARIVGDHNVYSFEANPALESLIRRNYALNGLFPDLTIAMLGEGNGEETFYIARDFWASSPIAGAQMEEITVPRRNLNATITALSPTFLLMDIEGGEVEIVKALKPGTLRTVMIECHPSIVGAEAIEAMLTRLGELGFRTLFRSKEFSDLTNFQYIGRRAEA